MLIDCPFSWHSRHIIAFAFFAFFFTQGAIAEHGIGPAYLPSENAFQGTKIDSILVSAESRNAPFPVISLPVVTDISNKEAPRQVGFARVIPDAYQDGIDSRQLRWKPVPKGGYVTSLVIKSPGAQALRVRLDVTPDTERLEIRFFSPDQVIGPYTVAKLKTLSSWSPIIPGETLGIELYLPEDNSPPGFKLLLQGISHFSEYGPFSSNRFSAIGRGASSSCNLDLRCYDQYRNIASSVATFHITRSDGNSYFCSGVLLNDKDTNSYIPYFLTAGHCVSSQTEASTLVSNWLYESTLCNSGIPHTPLQLLWNGATLLASDNYVDFAFLRLIDSPGGAYMAGWQPTKPALNMHVTGIHHPNSDLKKISFGSVAGFVDYIQPIPTESPPVLAPDGAYAGVLWNSGILQHGSSGSPLFQDESQNTGRVIGIDSRVTPDPASCSESSGAAYTRFDLIYPKIKAWLEPQAIITGAASGAIASTTLAVTIRPIPGDIGKTANIYFAYRYRNAWYLQDGITKTWKLFTGAALPVFQTVTMNDPVSWNLYTSGDFSKIPSGVEYYIGYGIDDADLLSGKYGVVYTAP